VVPAHGLSLSYHLTPACAGVPMTARMSPETEAKVAGLRASGMRHDGIAKATGAPRRTVSNILARTPVVEIVTSMARDEWPRDEPRPSREHRTQSRLPLICRHRRQVEPLTSGVVRGTAESYAGAR
jgi:hypothetical protein